MERLLIYELDSDKEPISTLKIGEYTFGRGALLKCDDRRVSRNHGIIKITEETATIASTHQNPCFYQSANGSTITILPKDTPLNINDGDKFALLADKYWFRIKIKIASDNCKNGPEDSTCINIENGYHEPTASTAEPTTRSNVMDNEEGTSDDCELWVNSFDFKNHKRNLEDNEEKGTSNIKKVKYENNNEAEEDQLLSVLSDLKRTQESDKEDKTAVSESITKKEQISDSEDDTNDKIPDSGNKDKAVVSNASKERKRNVKAAAATQNVHDAELKAMLFSSDEETEQEIKTNNAFTRNIENDDKSDKNKINNDDNNKDRNDDTNAASTSSSNKREQRDHEIHNTQNDDKSDKNEINNDDNNEDVNDDTNAASTSGSSKRERRDHCWYGLNCYRKNPAHLAEYTHPGDSDYESDPEDDRPICPYGAACYRRNKDHRQAYRHSSKPQKPAGKRADKTNNDGGVNQKKRTAKKQYYEDTPEDDYDLDDPFINDSSTDYQASSDEDDDSDSEWSGEESENETKRMLKEAKKFTKGKK